MNKTRLTILICVILSLLTLAAYWRVLGCGFVTYDDDLYVTANRWVQAGPTRASIKWAFAAPHASNWHPVTWISHMVDCRIWGMNPLGHHLHNLILHMLSAVLLLLLMRRMTGRIWASAFVAALFALHPLHVESVAWVSERKDVLSTLLWMLTMHAYVSYVRKPGTGVYLLAPGLFALGLMAKPMLVTLPLTLLLLDYWPLGRFAGKEKPAERIRKLLWEKSPFFILSGASCVMTYIAQRSEGVVSLDKIAVGIRASNAVVSYVAYIGKTIWPQKLAVIYPHPMNTIPLWQVAGSAFFLAAVTVLVLRSARTRPYLAIGWLWYVITLIPVIGLVQVGMQSMADRYAYVPLIGLSVALTWAAVGLVGPVRRVGAFLALLVILALSAVTWHQTGYWKDSISLFQRAVDVTERNAVAETNLGGALIDAKRYDEAIAHERAAIRIKPGARPYNNIGVALERMGKPDQAVLYYRKAVEIAPEYATAQYNLGHALCEKHLYEEAAGHLEAAISREPENADSHYYLAYSLTEMGRKDEAVEHYRLALRNNPRYYLADYNLGVVLSDRGKYEEAVDHFNHAISIRPSYVRAHHNLALALDSLDRTEEAMREYREAIRLQPSLGEAHNNLAIDLYAVGRYSEAWKEAKLARKSGATPNPEFIKALSARMVEQR